MVLKADIEGCEWEMINSSDMKTLEQFDQITMEFHRMLDIETAQKRLNALRKLAQSFVVIHIHANSGGQLYFCGDLIMPITLELTFVRKGVFDVKPSSASVFPTFYDEPNAGYADNMFGKW